MPDTIADGSPEPAAAIEIRLSRAQQLFNSLDPRPSTSEIWIRTPRNTSSTPPTNPQLLRVSARRGRAQAQTLFPRRAHLPVGRTGVPIRVYRPPSARAGRRARPGGGDRRRGPVHRRLGGHVATPGGLPLRLAADPAPRATLRQAGSDPRHRASDLRRRSAHESEASRFRPSVLRCQSAAIA
jgi:hypothetical protein